MKKQLIGLSIILLATGITYSLMAIPAKKPQQQKVTLHLSIQEVELVLKALGKLPLEESGNLYMGIQQQAQQQLQPAPQKPKGDSTSKSKKP